MLVRVRAAGVDPGVWHLMTGEPYLVRAMGFGLRKPKVAVRGRDVAGVHDVTRPSPRTEAVPGTRRRQRHAAASAQVPRPRRSALTGAA